MSIDNIVFFIHHFFFEYYVSTEFLGFYRIITCGTILSYLVYIYKDIWKFTKPDGIFNYDFFHIHAFHAFKINKLLYLFQYKSFSVILYISLYIFGIFALIGFFTNLSLICFFILLMSFQHRIRPILQSGGDVIANFLLFNLMLMPTGLSLSVDKYIFNYDIDFTYGWPLRLIQVTLTLGYLSSALHKMRSWDWGCGHALKNALLFTMWSKNRFKKLFANELIFKSANYITVWFQILAPFFFWIQELRLPTIIIGILIHFIMILTLKIGYFGPIMIVAILSFAANYFQ
jgi:hypothetical protein